MLFRTFLVLVTAVALAMLCRYTYQKHALTIQSKVSAVAESKLTSQTGHALELAVDGRNLMLSGSVESIESIHAIRQVLQRTRIASNIDTSQVQVDAETTSQIVSSQQFSSRITASPEGMTLSGDAPSRAARARAQALIGEDVSLDINTSGDKAWMDLVILVSEYRRMVEYIEIDYSGTVATVTGRSSDPDTIRNLRVDLANLSTARMNILETLTHTAVGN